ncbi:MAG: septation protein IspZ [Algicola sp.]|nr:septation protein IspZ [Algicola sp.]
MNTKLLSVIITLISIAYPAIVFFGLQHFSPSIIASVLLLVILARLMLQSSAGNRSNKKPAPWVKASLLMASTLLLCSALLNSTKLIQFYPVVVNLTLLTVFVMSLIRPPSVIETLARMTDPGLPLTGVAYTRKVTIAWAIFFAVNALIAAYTALFMSLQSWTIYNGLIAYILIGLMFGIEYLIRRQVKAKNTTKQNH